MSNRYSKKGDVSISLSWVFMIIVGVFFIILAYNIIDKYMENEDVKYNIELKNVLRNIFNEFGRTTGTEKNSLAKLGNIFRNSEVEIICSDGIPILSIDSNMDANNEFLRSYPTFMTYVNQDKVDFTYMAVENFRMPFKITNMLAIVSKKNLIVIDSSSDIGVKLEAKFRKTSYNDLNYVVIDFSSGFDTVFFVQNYVREKSLNSVAFVTDRDAVFDVDLADIGVLSNLIEVEQSSNSLSGMIYYTDEEGEEYDFDYIDYDESLALVTMALFSVPEVFGCSYDLLLDDIVTSYDFYENKTNYFMNYGSLVCLSSYSVADQNYYYSDFKDLLEDISEEVKTNKFNNVLDIISSIDSLEQQYYRLEDSSCPYIY